MMKTFGEFVKELRLQNKITLRQFCRLINTDPSNWSKIERGILSPPKSKTVLNEIADVLNLKINSENYNTLLDLAAISQIPVDLVGDRQVLDKLPVFFRTLRGQKPTDDELEKLIQLLKEN